MNTLKKENETHFEYVKRLTENRKDYNLSYSKWGELITNGATYSDDNCRKFYYLVVPLLEALDEDIESRLVQQAETEGVSSLQELVEELEQKKIELFKEKVKLQDQRRNYLSLVRTEARWEALFDLIHENLSQLEPLIIPATDTQPSLEVEGTLVLSDWHIGSLINTPHNQFNLEIAKERIAKLKTNTIKYCHLHGIKKLNVCVLGDMTNGHIHLTTRLNNQEDVVSQTIKCSELLSQLIYELALEIDEIVVHYSVGNHGRVSPNIKESLDSENFEYLVLEFLKLRLQQCDNVTFNDCQHIDKEIVLYDVFGQTIACVHGHREKKLFSSASVLSDFLRQRIDLVILGHFHNFATQNNVIVNGSLSGCDAYANNLRFNNPPSQTLIVHFNTGGKCLYEMTLD